MIQHLPKLLMAVFIVLLVIVSIDGHRNHPAKAKAFLEQQGYTNVRMTGHRYFMGGENDVFSTGFEANNPFGNPVSGAVTSGWMKGYTIRFD